MIVQILAAGVWLLGMLAFALRSRVRQAEHALRPPVVLSLDGQVPRSRLVGTALYRSGERKHGRSVHLTLHEQNKPWLGSVGQLLRPALLSPRRRERDYKGRALGVKESRWRSQALGHLIRSCDKDRYPKGQDKRAPPFGLVAKQ